MRKLLLVALVAFAFAFVLGSGAAQAQSIDEAIEDLYYQWQGDQVQLVTSRNLRMIDRLHGQLDRANFRSLAHDLVWHQGYLGLWSPSGLFRPILGCRGRRAFAFGGIGGLLGTGIGLLTGKPAAGALLGAGGGAALGYALPCNGRRDSDDYRHDDRRDYPMAYGVPVAMQQPTPQFRVVPQSQQGPTQTQETTQPVPPAPHLETVPTEPQITPRDLPPPARDPLATYHGTGTVVLRTKLWNNTPHPIEVFRCTADTCQDPSKPPPTIYSMGLLAPDGSKVERFLRTDEWYEAWAYPFVSTGDGTKGIVKPFRTKAGSMPDGLRFY